ncbi:MAG: nucleotidyltransferase family protein [Acidobacteria bacterium]|nr:nucleotidyltransferase family protein [Acidobacteriota bacterium]
MLAAVILSGGASQRMGSPKALLPYRGKTFLEHLLEVSTHPQIGERRVVLGPHAEAITSNVPMPDSEIVVNPEWEKGQLSSIHAAIRSLPADIDGMMLFLVDHPLVSSALVDILTDRFYGAIHSTSAASSSAGAGFPNAEISTVGAGLAPPGANKGEIVLPTYNGKRGHPVIFASSLFPELLAAPMEQGARSVVWAHATEVIEVPTTEAGCVMNVNDSTAFQRFLEA